MTQIDTSTEAVEALLNGVTPGPWTIQKAIVAETPFDWWIYAEGFGVLGYRTGHKEHHEGVTSWGHIETDAIFIAAARELVPALLAERDALKAEVATCVKYRDAYAECDRIGTQAVRDLEAKLTKAVEALETIVDNGGAGSYHLSRTTLAELNYDERS